MNILLHVDLAVRNADASIDFYVKGLGGTVIEDAIIDGDAVEFYSSGAASSARLVMVQFTKREPNFGAMIELMEFRDAQGVPLPSAPRVAPYRCVPGICNLSIQVPNIDKAVEVLRGMNVTPLTAILRVSLPRLGNSRALFVADPDDNLIELIDNRADPAPR